jgi:hypothetical protein
MPCCLLLSAKSSICHPQGQSWIHFSAVVPLELWPLGWADRGSVWSGIRARSGSLRAASVSGASCQEREKRDGPLLTPSDP